METNQTDKPDRQTDQTDRQVQTDKKVPNLRLAQKCPEVSILQEDSSRVWMALDSVDI